MIKNIRSLQNFGIFRDCNNAGAKDFGKFNLIYGWNGSGKSTLSTLFESIEKCIPLDSKRFPSAEFSITLHEEGAQITHQNISEKRLNIHTFNQQFIKENIDWNNAVKSILLIDKEKIGERKELDGLKVSLERESAKYINEESALTNLRKSNNKFLSESAARIKESLQLIGTQDSRYLNYDKTKLETFIRTRKNEILAESGILDLAQIVELTNSSKPLQKPELSILFPKFSASSLSKAKVSLEEILSTNITGNFLERLTKNSDINKWASEGLTIHAAHQSTACEFCGHEITKERMDELTGHFNDQLKTFNDRLLKADEWLQSQYLSTNDMPTEDRFYDEFKERYTLSLSNLKSAVDNINIQIKIWHETLKKKIENTFDVKLAVMPISEISIKQYAEAIQEVKAIEDLHNNKTANFQKETSESKEKLELHYATSVVSQYEFFSKIDSIESRNKENADLKIKTDKLRSDIQKIEMSLSNEGIGADQFNKSLHRFIGRSELSLKFDKEILGYEIIRNNNGKHDGNLSEGEKTAIAFVYFITKLSEKNNNISDTIVVVDDPVSSFDSNHLFHAYAFMRAACEGAKQLFVLTHNFTFFKLVRDWFSTCNANRAKKQKTQNAFFYVIQTSSGTPRKSTIVNADNSLVEYNSEYHYIFSQLYRFKEQENLSRDDAFLTANLARKLLEAFFSFKYPLHRNNISALMDCGLENCKITNSEIKEKIYRFINKYSHNIGVEINEDSSENLAGESGNVLKDMFEWMREVDQRHYTEMQQAVTA